ncbi:MAG: protein kinase [bacterium]|nr:protein kinase [bacterium]
MKGVYLFALTVFLFSFHLFSQSNIKFDRFTIQDGLSQNTVSTILRDNKGFLWFGTEDGLNRYDGYTFKVYRHNPDNPNSLSNNRIQVLYQKEPGIIWIGTYGGGLNKFDQTTETFTRYTRGPSGSDSLSNDIVWSICGEGADVLWIGTNSGLNRFEPGTGEFSHWFREPGTGEGDSLSCNRIKVVHEDRSGNLWLGTLGGGLNLFDREQQKFFHYKHSPNGPPGLSNNYVSAIYEDRTGILWIGTDKGVNRFDAVEKQFVPRGNESNLNLNPLNDSSIFSIYESSCCGVSIGTYGEGLWEFDLEKGTFTHYAYSSTNPSGLSSNYIQRVYEDITGVLWIGTDNGLNKLDKNKKKFGHRQMEPDNSDSLSNNSVWAIYKDREGILWIGTENGLEQLDRENNKWSRQETGIIAGHRDNNKISSIYEDKTGILWFSFFEHGLYRFDSKKKTTRHYKHNPKDPQSLSSNRVNLIREDTTEALWLGTRNGLNRFDRKTEIFTCYKNVPVKNNSINNDYIITIYEDRSGLLWIGTKGGLNLFHRENETFTHWEKKQDDPNSLTNNNVSSIWEGRPGVFWIGTWGGGLNKFDRNKNTFKHYLEKDGLSNEYIHGILGDEDGNLWMSTNKGISRFDPEEETFKNYDMGDGLQGSEFNGGACFKSGDGEMFFGGNRGFNAFYPKEITDNPHIPPIVITDFQLLNEHVKIGPGSPLRQSITETREIVLPHDHYVLSFEFSALDFTNPSKNRYAFMMDEFDEDWIHRDSNKRFVTYTNLDPGEYVFRVKGTNNDGVWNEKETAIKIIIIPPIWGTLWFRVLALLCFAVLSYVTINFVKKYITLAGFWKGEKYVGQFKLLEKIGSGGMGTIYKAQNTMDKTQPVAVKVLKDELFDDESSRKRFKQEAAIVDQLDHPHIVKIIERGQSKQKLFIVMELLEGKTLAKKISEEGKIDLIELVEIFLQVTEALVKIHEKCIVHRDLKPDNVMLTKREDSSNFVKLLDFGIARTEQQSRITRTGTILGTLNYLAPEQISDGNFSPASDIYSLGGIFYEAVTGEIPFPGETTTDIMRKIIYDMPTKPCQLRPDTPPRLNKLILRMLEKQSGDRPPVGDVLIELLEIENSQTKKQ